MRMLWFPPGIILMLCFLPVHVKGDASSELTAVQDDFYHWLQQTWPTFARLPDMSIESFHTHLARVQLFIIRLSTIDRGLLSRHQQYSHDIFRDYLYAFAKNYDWRNYGPLNPVNFLEGFYLNLDTVVEIAPFENKQDFDNYISILEAWPIQINQMIDRMNRAIQLGTTYHNASVRAVPGQIMKVTNGAPKDSALYAPFNTTLGNLTSIPQSEQTDLKSRGLTAIHILWTALNSLKTYMENTYLLHTRATYGVHGLPSGRQYYRACLQWHLTVDMSPEFVHRTGLREVDRISQLMTQVMTKQGFNGTIREYFTQLNADPQFQMHSKEDILQGYDYMIHNRTYPKLPQLFKDIPPLPVVVKPLPFDGIFGMYFSGSADENRPGVFYANVIRPNDTNSYSMMSLALHETVPGHHLQFIYRVGSAVPMYQKHLFYGPYHSTPFNFPYFTAQSEGWALYAEYLGEELGVYADDYELMGRYGSEMFRACRLVVDTGLHYLRWTRADAIQYLSDRIPMAPALIEIEVDRYLTWPGQACAYKIGELKIKELRQKAAKALGSKFDVRDFHALLLTNGRFSLTVMEAIVDDFIADNTDANTRPKNQGSVPQIYSLLAGTVGIHVLLASIVYALLQR